MNDLKCVKDLNSNLAFNAFDFFFNSNPLEECNLKNYHELLTEGLLIIFLLWTKNIGAKSFLNFFQLGFSVFCEIIGD